MLKKIILGLAVAMFFAVASKAQAAVFITELMADPGEGPEWIEIWNDGGEDVDLSTWKWTELSSPGTASEHESSPKSITGIISSNTGLVIEMNSALNNAGDSIGLYKGEEEMDRVTFGKVSGFSADVAVSEKGKSSALIGGAWFRNQDPSQGVKNPESADEENENNSSASESQELSGQKNSVEEAAPKKVYKIKVEISAPSVAHVGIPFSLGASGTGSDGRELSRGIFYWNFGDGDSREVKASSSQKFAHVYFYPGDYSISLNYYGDAFAEDPEASDMITLKVIEPKIIISRVGDAPDFFVEITNETGSSADISGWAIFSAYKIFVFPKNTVIGPKKKMLISPNLSHFDSADVPTLKLMTREREIISDYLGDAYSKVVSKTTKTRRDSEPISLSSEPLQEEILPPARALPALAYLGMEGEKEEEEGKWVQWSAISGLLVIVGSGIGITKYIRRRPIISASGQDFEILDE